LHVLNLDHVAHFVPDIDSASSTLEKLGFTLTPFSAHSHRVAPEAPLIPAGTGNRCVMLKRGYLEFLTPIGNTNTADELRSAIQRYTGPHLIAFGTTRPEADYQRLAGNGFGPLDPVTLRRDIETADGRATASFTVVRVPSGTMAEGRIQYCQHHTPDLLWQSRWLAHPNGAVALNGVIVCVTDPQETAARYGRYTGLPFHMSGSVGCLATARGSLMFLDPVTLKRRLHVGAPAVPWIAGCILESEDMGATGDHLRKSSWTVNTVESRLLIELPPSVGGIVIFEPKNSQELRL
jgi:hypothetical protein